MEIIGRITADATVNTVSGNRQVVNFSVAVNDSYRNREGERVELTEYYRCAYWLTPRIAQYLTKGALVQLTGWVNSNAWLDKEGKPRVSLNFRASQIRFHGSNKSVQDQTSTEQRTATGGDDMPF